MTITLAWWWIPLILVAIGIVWGWIIGSHEEGGLFNFAPLIGLAVFAIFAGAAVAFTVGKLI